MRVNLSKPFTGFGECEMNEIKKKLLKKSQQRRHYGVEMGKIDSNFSLM